MKTISSLRLLVCSFPLLTCASAQAQNTSAIWDTDAAGNWTDVLNWTGDSAYASGVGNTATLGNFIAGNRIITLDAPITIGNITVADITHNYTLSGANVLTLDVSSGAPVVDVTSGRTFTISSQISGSDGLEKTGAGTLLLSNINNNYTGGTVLSAGTISFGTNSDVYLGATSGALTFNGGGMTYSDDFVLNRDVIVNPAKNMALTNRIVVNGVLSGTGSISQSGSDSATFANTANTFTGTVTAGYAMTFASLGDSSNPYNIGNNSVAFAWTGGAKTFALRPFTFSTAGSAQIRSSGSGALVIQQNLAVTGAAGTRNLFLGGSFAGASNLFSGDIANGVGSTVSITKEGDGSIWALSGTNTYTGPTSLVVAGSTPPTGGAVVFQGIQALSPSTSLNATSSASNGGKVPGVFRILDDSASPATRSGVNINWTGANGQDPLTIFVGNNNTANLGNSAGTTTGSTIQLGNMNFSQTSGSTAGLKLDVTGANGYKLQINDINVTLQAAHNTNLNIQLNPTTAPLTVTGTVRQANDAGASSATTLQLNGTASGNLVSGNILDSAGGRLMNVSKLGLADWTLSGSNGYTGATTITTGKLLFSGANALPTAGTVAVGAAGHLSLADGVARNQTVSALTLTSLGSLSFDWTGSGTGDQLTSTADITPTAGSRFAVSLNRSGTPGGSVTLLTGGAGSTLDQSTFYLANTTDYTATLSTPTPNTLVVDSYTGQSPLTTFYWQGNKLAAGAVAGVDNAWALSDGTKTNWSSTTTGYTSTALTPGATADVIFANGQTGKTQQSTVLGADVTVNSVTIDDGTAVTIAGANGAALTLMGTSSAAGTAGSPGSAISVTATAANPTISSNVILGANQTWNVASGKTLTVSGIVSGGFSLTKADAGTLAISALPTYTGATTLSAGTLTLSGGVTGGASLIGISSAITLGQGTTLNLNPSAAGITNPYTVPAPITLSGGAGTANIRVGGNDVRVNLVGNVTGQSGVAQTLAITQGYTVTSGDRENVLFSGVIADGGGGGSLAVSVNFSGSSTVAQNAFVNLSGQNTFTGDLTVTNSKGLNAGTGDAGAWLTIGGERYRNNGAGQNYRFVGTGYLGGGDYSGNISISNGTGKTTLSYLSTANQIIRGVISGTGSLQMDGTGTLTLTAANTYTGATTVAAGTLRANNTTGSGTGTGLVTVSAGATLGGDGIISGATSVDGTLAAGNGIGSLGVGALTLNPGSTFVQEISDETSTGADLVYSTGDLSFAGTVTLNLLNTGSRVWQPNDKITLISYAGSLTLGSGFSYPDGNNGLLADGESFTFAGTQWVFDYDDTSAGTNYAADAASVGGTPSYVTMTVAIPEAGTAGLLALGLLLLRHLRRRGLGA